MLIDDICIHRKKDVVKPTISSDFQPVLNSTPPNLKRLWKNLALPGSLLSNYLSGDESSEEESLITFFESCRGGWANLGKVVTPSLCQSIEEESRGQDENPVWLDQRRGRITASIAHQVLHCTTGQKGLVDLILGRKTFLGNRHTIYGKTHESLARSLFRERFFGEHRNAKMWETGLIVNAATPHFGASPDAMVSCSCHGTGVIEIKCPSTGAEKTLEEYVALKNDVALDENGNLKLLTGKWYTQIQMQLALTKANFGEFVLYLGIAPYLHHCTVHLDDQEWEIAQEKLTSFFQSHVLPEICP